MTRRALRRRVNAGNQKASKTATMSAHAHPVRVLTDNAADTVRGILLVALSYLILTIGDTAAKWAILATGVAWAMLWRGVFGAVAVIGVHRRGPGQPRPGAVPAGALEDGRAALRAVVVHHHRLVSVLAAYAIGRHLRSGLHRAADHDRAGGAAAGRAHPLAPRAVHAGRFRRRAGHGAAQWGGRRHSAHPAGACC